MIVSKKLIVRGKVQGVWYRASARKAAESLALCGFVENLNDGCVHIQVEGKAKAVESFIKWCWLGPQYAKVSEVIEADKEVVGYKAFEIK